MDRLIGFVKIFNVVAGIILVLGVIIIGWTIFERSGSRLSAPGEIELFLPAGARIVEMVPTADRVIVLTEKQDGEQRVLILDPTRPEAVTTLSFSDVQP